MKGRYEISHRNRSALKTLLSSWCPHSARRHKQRSYRRRTWAAVPTEKRGPVLAKLRSERQPRSCVIKVAWYNAHASEGAQTLGHLFISPLPAIQERLPLVLASHSFQFSTIWFMQQKVSPQNTYWLNHFVFPRAVQTVIARGILGRLCLARKAR